MRKRQRREEAEQDAADILYAYRFFPETFAESLNIPESGNGMPDILNECLYELKWLLKMQMKDGSVCHKLTSMRHANFVMPSEDKRQFILFPPSSMAAADFAAVMALASRVYAVYEADFSRTALEAARRAWTWLEDHPGFIGFENPEGCNTGGYEDTDDRDESLCRGGERYGTEGRQEAELQQKYRAAFTAEADRITVLSRKSGYGAALEAREYEWGSNMIILNRAMILGTAYRLVPEDRYIKCAAGQMDYILGVLFPE